MKMSGNNLTNELKTSIVIKEPTGIWLRKRRKKRKKSDNFLKNILEEEYPRTFQKVLVTFQVIKIYFLVIFKKIL